jgi:hypothetical protein
MNSRQAETIKVFDNQIKSLAEDSKKFNQETRVSVFLFGSHIECVIYDMDVLRLPSLASLYKIEGNTKLIDATILAIDDLQKVPTQYGDHAFLFYVLTDGQENESHSSASSLQARMNGLPENWTFVAFVPNRTNVGPTSRFGFPVDNIAVWSTTSGGITEAGVKIKSSSSNFMRARASGIRGSSSLFTLDTSNLTRSKVSRNLNELTRGSYTILPVRKDCRIDDFVESQGLTFGIGFGYYELTKRVLVQAYKKIYVRNRSNGKVYGGADARQLLGLPDEDVKVSPDNHSDFDIFIQSTAPNRKLLAGTSLLYLR